MIDYIRLHIHIEFEDHISPYFLEALIRGALGYKLRDLVCINKKIKDCRQCMIKNTCAFALIYAAEPEGDERIIETASIPPPLNFFIYKKGVGMNHFIELTLFKPLFNYVNHIVFALIELGKEGIGRERICFIVKNIADQTDDQIIFDGQSLKNSKIRSTGIVNNKETESSISELSIDFITPVRLKRNNKLIDEISFYELIKSSLLRYSILSESYGTGETTENAKEILSKSESVRVKSSSLLWKKHERFSSTQKQKVSFGGVVGQVVYEGEIEPFLNIVEFGTQFGIGKNTSFGCGRLIINNQ